MVPIRMSPQGVSIAMSSEVKVSSILSYLLFDSNSYATACSDCFVQKRLKHVCACLSDS